MKATVKAALFTATLILGAFSTVLYTASCEPDKCKGIVCAYGGTCSGGRCLCKDGYEGLQCETINRKRYIGVWQVDEDGTLSAQNLYALAVEEGALVTDVIIRNLHNTITADVEATVKGDTITIPFQNAGRYNVVGKGYIHDYDRYGEHGAIEMRYSVIDTLTGVDDNFGLDSGKVSMWNK